jgi:hypothetical protein
MGAVQNALLRDGKDPKIMELNPDESLKSQLKAAEVSDNDPPLNEDPEYQKYFKMLKMGLPMGAVQNALIRDGKDPRILLSDSKASSALTKASRPQTNVKNSTQALKKPKVRRKKIYWNSLDETKILAGSIWSLSQDDMPLDELMLDMQEFESLFTEPISTEKNKPKHQVSAPKQAKEPKKSTQVIEGKRGMNGGIVLARIKHEFTDLADMVDCM